MGYIIVGDTEKYKDCLVSVVHGDINYANEVLDRMLNNPTKNDLILTEGMSNLRVEDDGGHGWWKDGE